MVWTHFTSYLDGSREIFKAERDELMDNFKAAIEACPGGYTVDATVLAAVKASDLFSDRCTINGPVGFGGSLSGAIGFVDSSVFNPTGFSVIATAGADEGLTSAELNSLFDAALYRHRKTEFQSHHFWNILKRTIHSLQCGGSSMAITCRSRSASKNKCGFAEFGTPSSPPKIYRTRTQSGTITFNYGTLEDPINYGNAYSGGITVARSTCTESGVETLAVSGPGCGSESFEHSAEGSGVYRWVREGSPDCTVSNTGGSPKEWTIDSTTVKHVDAASWGDPDMDSGAVTVTLSDEYTDAEIGEDVDTVLAAASWSAYGSTFIDSIFDRSSDGITFTKREVDWKFAFAAVAAGWRLKYDIYSAETGLVSHQCVNLATGATEHVYRLAAPTSLGSLYLVWVALQAGTC